ncbi:DUF742 domain-containing protein [Kitasatospora sp. McL0602]|uniref:DUF742 domain-containing protein n=1 Tax=Kitasatospora sp. McL0602 TaxID=3439530 RepID=UPI003F892B8C
MTPPDDRSGQYGVPYPGTGHDAFGAPGVGHGQQYEQQYGQQYDYGQQQHQQQQFNPFTDQQYAPSAPDHRVSREGFPEQVQRSQQMQSQHGRQQHGQHPGQHPVQYPGHVEDPGYAEEYDDEEESGPLIRPFAMTGGRTRPRYELALEALVSANVAPERLATMLPEHQRICTLCTEVKSVAEVSALLNIPLGVARILVADLAEAGLVAIHQPAAGGESGNQPDVTLLERVLSGLRKL